MRHFSLVLALLAGCAGGGELQQPNPPPDWPLGGLDPDELPDGSDVPPPTAPPAALAADTDEAAASDTDGAPAPADGEATPPEDDATPATPAEDPVPDGDDAN